MRDFELFLLREKKLHVNTSDMVKLFNFTSANYVERFSSRQSTGQYLLTTDEVNI